MTTTKTLPLALGLLFTLALPLQAQTFTAAAGPQLNQVIENIGGSPQLVYWNGSGGSISRYAWATVDRGTMTCFARSEHYDPATFQSDAMGYASWKATDVVFESAGSGIATVGVNLTLEGDHWLLLGNGVSLSMSMNGQGLGSATATASGVSGSGYLSGYGMSGQVSFTHYVTVPLNTAVNLQMRLDVGSHTSLTGFKNWGEYNLRLGGSTPLSPTYAPFDLPAGVTVNSPSLGIVDNVWELPSEAHLFASDTNLTAGESVQLTAWNQPTGSPVGMLYSWGVPTPPLAFSTRSYTGLIATFDSKGWWSPAAIAHQPWMAGLELRARAVTQGPAGGLVLSEPVTIQFQ